jgi:hypothetical protein
MKNINMVNLVGTVCGVSETEDGMQYDVLSKKREPHRPDILPVVYSGTWAKDFGVGDIIQVDGLLTGNVDKNIILATEVLPGEGYAEKNHVLLGARIAKMATYKHRDGSEREYDNRGATHHLSDIVIAKPTNERGEQFAVRMGPGYGRESRTPHTAVNKRLLSCQRDDEMFIRGHLKSSIVKCSGERQISLLPIEIF